MIARNFYRFEQAVGRLGTEGETLKQAMAMGNVSPFLRFRGNFARALGADDDGRLDVKGDPYCGWRKFTRQGEVPDDIYYLDGWFRILSGCARRAGRNGFFEENVFVAPSRAVDTDTGPWEWFSVPLPATTVRQGDDGLIFASEVMIEDAWFLASEIDAFTAKALVASKWPWGDHDTPALGHLAAAAKQFWSTYEPGARASTNSEVVKWLVEQRHVTPRLAKSIATILRAENLKPGPRRKL
jgi:hypothetical protein